MPDGQLLSHDVVRFQTHILQLYSYGVLPKLMAADRAGQKLRVLEIGPGYGGLAHHLKTILPRATFVFLDLPETMILSAPYLALLHPQARHFMYEPEAFDADWLTSNVDTFDFVFLPNSRAEVVARMDLDLVVNVASLQEMRVARRRDPPTDQDPPGAWGCAGLAPSLVYGKADRLLIELIADGQPSDATHCARRGVRTRDNGS